MTPRLPQRPVAIDPLADELLTELCRHPVSSEIVLGGYFALKHYCDYRVTHDVDAWWRSSPNPEAESAISGAMGVVAERQRAALERRGFGETQSWELRQPESGKAFSFQIAVRSQTLEPVLVSPWPPIAIESLADNIAAKMQALVNRGAPRDLRDIHRLVSSGYVTVDECWSLWQRKNPGAALADAQRKVHLHLAALETRRPLTSIVDPAEHAAAESVREWTRDNLANRRA